MRGKATQSAAVAAVRLGRLGDFVGFRLRRIQNQLSREFNGKASTRGMRPGLFSALAIIEANPGLSQARLTHEIGLDKSQTVAVIDDLESKGLARRGRAPNDRRRYALHITDKGRQTLDSMFEDLAIVERDVLDTLDAEELAVLSTLLDRLYEATFHNGQASRT